MADAPDELLATRGLREGPPSSPLMGEAALTDILAETEVHEMAFAAPWSSADPRLASARAGEGG